MSGLLTFDDQHIPPRVVSVPHGHIDPRVRCPTTKEALYLPVPSPLIDSLNHPTPGRNNIPKETEHIKKIRLTDGIRPNNKQPRADIKTQILEVLPVLDVHMRELHAATFIGSSTYRMQQDTVCDSSITSAKPIELLNTILLVSGASNSERNTMCKQPGRAERPNRCRHTAPLHRPSNRSSRAAWQLEPRSRNTPTWSARAPGDTPARTTAWHSR